MLWITERAGTAWVRHFAALAIVLAMYLGLALMVMPPLWLRCCEGIGLLDGIFGLFLLMLFLIGTGAIFSRT